MRNPIDRYLAALDDELWRIPPRMRRRIREEVRGHLDDAAASAQSSGDNRERAEAAAVQRFGDPAAVAQRFFEEGIASASDRAWRSTLPFLAIAGVMYAGISTPRWSFGSMGGPDAVAMLFVIVGVQVAFVAGLITLVRVVAQQGSRVASRDAAILRSCRVGLVAGLPAIGVITAGVVLALAGREFGTFASPIGVLVTGLFLASWILLVRSVRRAARARDWVCLAKRSAAEARPIGDLVIAWQATIAHAGRFGSTRRAAALIDRAVCSTVAAARSRAPRLCSWLDLEAHPWGACTAVAFAAGALAFAGGAIHDIAVENGIAYQAGIIFGAVEAGLVVAGFAVLGPLLGLRVERA